MPVDATLVYRKAAAFVEALAAMPAKDKKGNPWPEFREDYNSLLELAQEVVPDLDDRLWPPQVGLLSAYVEVEAYARTILLMVAPRANAGTPAVVEVKKVLGSAKDS